MSDNQEASVLIDMQKDRLRMCAAWWCAGKVSLRAAVSVVIETYATVEMVAQDAPVAARFYHYAYLGIPRGLRQAAGSARPRAFREGTMTNKPINTHKYVPERALVVPDGLRRVQIMFDCGHVERLFYNDQRTKEPWRPCAACHAERVAILDRHINLASNPQVLQGSADICTDNPGQGARACLCADQRSVLRTMIAWFRRVLRARA